MGMLESTTPCLIFSHSLLYHLLNTRMQKKNSNLAELRQIPHCCTRQKLKRPELSPLMPCLVDCGKQQVVPAEGIFGQLMVLISLAWKPAAEHHIADKLQQMCTDVIKGVGAQQISWTKGTGSLPITVWIMPHCSAHGHITTKEWRPWEGVAKDLANPVRQAQASGNGLHTACGKPKYHYQHHWTSTKSIR